jgi:hypothetical protein
MRTMDIYEVLNGESRTLEKLTRKLVDSTSAEPQTRERLLHEIVARFDSQQVIREEFVYPELRLSAGREDLVDECDGRVFSIRGRIEILQGLFMDSTSGFQISAEMLDQEIESLTNWEIHQTIPVMQDTLSAEEAATFGERAQAMQDQYMAQQL